jgi:hypothetical protein
LEDILFSKKIHDMEVNFDMSIRQKAIIGSLQAAHAQNFRRAIP